MAAQPLVDLAIRLRMDTTSLSGDARTASAAVESIAPAAQAAASSITVADRAAQKFLQTLSDQIATTGMTSMQKLAYQASQLGVSEQAAPMLAQLDQVRQAMSDAANATTGAAGALNAFGETEAEAAARISDMVARSREAQAAMGATADSVNLAASSSSAFGASAEQIRATVLAQTQAMSATSREMASIAEEMQTFNAIAAQGGATFDELGEQYTRLDRLMASGKLSMQEYDAALASIGKDEDRRLSQLSALTSRYDPLDAATRKLTADQALLDDAYRNGQVTADEYQRSLAGIKADQAVIGLKQLEQQATQVKNAFKAGETTYADYRAAMKDIAASRSALSEVAGAAESAGAGMSHFGLNTAGARTELLRLVNDLANGNFGRLDQSATVLAERMDLLGAAATPVGAVVLGVTAAIGSSAVVALHAAASMAQYGEGLTKLSQQTGISTDELQKIGYGLETVGGKSVDSGVALDTLAKKIADAQSGSKDAQATFQALGISLSGLKNLSMDQVLGKIADAFSQTADDAGKSAVAQELFGSASKDMIEYLDQGSGGLAELGAQAQDVGAVLDRSTIAKMNELGERLNTVHANMNAVSINASTAFLPVLDTISEELVDVSTKGGAVGTVFDVMSGVIVGSAAVIATAVLPLAQSAQSILTTYDVISKAVTGDFKGAKDALVSGWQEEMDMGKKYADFMKNLFNQKPVGNDGLDLGSGDDWSGKISPKKSGSGLGGGLVDKTQLDGDVKSIQDALAEQLSAVSSSQKQLDALYKSGGVSEAGYYQQSRDLIMQKATDEVDAYNSEAATLQKGLQTQKLSASQRAQIINQIADLHAKASKAIEDGMNGIAQSAADEDAAWAKYGEESEQAMQKQIGTAQQQDQGLKDQIATFGQTKSAIDALRASREDDAVAALEQGRANAIMNDDLAKVPGIDTAIEQAKSLSKALHSIADDQSVLDQMEAQKKVADQAVQDWKSASNSIEQGLTNALMTGFEHGKSFGQNLVDSLESMFKTLVLQPTIAPVAGSIAAMMYPGGAEAYAKANPGSPLVSLLSAGSAFSGANGFISGAAGLFGGLSNGAAASIANAEGGDVLGNFLSLTGNAGPSAAAANAFSGLGSFLGAAGTGYGVGSLVGNLFGGGTAGTGSQVGGTVGGIAGSFIPIPGGTFIGSAIGSALGGLVGSLFGGGETRYGASYAVDSSGNASKFAGPSGGDPQATQTEQSIQSTYSQIQSLATALGGSIADLGEYKASYEVSPDKGNSFVAAGFTNGSDWYPDREDLGGVKDSQTVLNDFSLQLQRSVIAALQQADVDKPYSDYLSQFDASTLTADQITTIEANLQTMESLFKAISGMGSDFDNLKKVSTDAQLAVVNLAGGIDSFGTASSYFYQHFTTAAQQADDAAKSVSDQLNALGYSGIHTRDQFANLVESLDLSTDAGQQAYVALLNLAPAFDTVVSSYESAVQSAYQTQSQALSSFKDQVDQFRDSLTTGQFSTASPEQQYDDTQQRFEQLYSEAVAGDTDAQSNLTSAAQDFLTASKAYNASSGQYQSDLTEVMQAMDYASSSADEQLDQLRQMVQGIVDVNDSVQTVAEAIAALQGWTAVDGSHASGLYRVPYDGYIAELHKGERVLTANEAQAMETLPVSAPAVDLGRYRSGSSDALLQEIKALRASNERLETEVGRLRADRNQADVAHATQRAQIAKQQGDELETQTALMRNRARPGKQA